MTAISKSVNNQFSDRVLELRRIAQVLSRKLVEDSEPVYDGRKHGTR